MTRAGRAWSRRDLLTGGLFRARPAAKPAAAPLMVQTRIRPARRARPGRSLPVHRPPGAVPEAAFLAGCTGCNDCARACPHDAIRPGDARLGAAAGTPVIDVSETPCRSCPDRACAVACPEGVLRLDRPGRMATVRLQPMTCLSLRGVGCTVCVEQCPVPDAIGWDGLRPVIDPSACTGCGVCVNACPAPGKALLLMPLLDRPEVA